MKSLDSLQIKLKNLLSKQHNLKIYPGYPWNPQELEDVARVVQDFIEQNQQDIDCELLIDWLCEYKFFQASQNNFSK